MIASALAKPNRGTWGITAWLAGRARPEDLRAAYLIANDPGRALIVRVLAEVDGGSLDSLNLANEPPDSLVRVVAAHLGVVEGGH